MRLIEEKTLFNSISSVIAIVKNPINFKQNMAKGISIKFKSYKDTVPKMLDLLKLGNELKKHDKIVLKPFLSLKENENTNSAFIEEVLSYCMKHKKPEAHIFIAEGADGADTMDLFNRYGYRELSDKYSVGLIDLNNAEVQEIEDGEFLKFSQIFYPKILLDGFIISLPKLSTSEETEINASLSNMLGAFPAEYYRGFFSLSKTKIRKFHIKYSIHDILKCKMPQFAVIDASDKGLILAGLPLDMDKQAAKLLGKDPRSIQHLRLIEQSFTFDTPKKEEAKVEKNK